MFFVEKLGTSEETHRRTEYISAMNGELCNEIIDEELTDDTSFDLETILKPVEITRSLTNT